MTAVPSGPVLSEITGISPLQPIYYYCRDKSLLHTFSMCLWFMKYIQMSCTKIKTARVHCKQGTATAALLSL